MKKLSVSMSLGAAGLATLLLLPVQGCTDLTENPPSLIDAGNFFHTVLFKVSPGKLEGTVTDNKGAVRDTFSKVVP